MRIKNKDLLNSGVEVVAKVTLVAASSEEQKMYQRKPVLVHTLNLNNG